MGPWMPSPPSRASSNATASGGGSCRCSPSTLRLGQCWPCCSAGFDGWPATRPTPDAGTAARARGRSSPTCTSAMRCCWSTISRPWASGQHGLLSHLPDPRGPSSRSSPIGAHSLRHDPPSTCGSAGRLRRGRLPHAQIRFSLAPMALATVLAKLMETSYMQSLVMSKGLPLMARPPHSAAFILLTTILSVGGASGCGGRPRRTGGTGGRANEGNWPSAEFGIRGHPAPRGGVFSMRLGSTHRDKLRGIRPNRFEMLLWRSLFIFYISSFYLR